MVPKGKYINVSLSGKNWKSIRKDAVNNFLKAESVVLGKFFKGMPGNLCGCRPRIVVKSAGHYFGDRWVAVGDSVLSRLYKDGIGSAFLTSESAMKSAVIHGISGADFKREYRKLCRSISVDNFIGSIMFRIFSRIIENYYVARSLKKCVLEESKLLPERRVFTILIWGMLTGDYSYRFLLGKLFDLRGAARLIKNMPAGLQSGKDK